MEVKRVVIWKHLFKLNESGSHTFIHQAYYKAFKHLGFETYWVDSMSKLNIDDLEGTLFLIEGKPDEIPLRDDCYYILHHVDNKQFIDKGCKFINLCNFLLGPLSNNESYNYPLDNSGDHGKKPLYPVEKIKDYVYYDIHNKAIYQPWATDLLPSEFAEEPLTFNPDIKELNFIGSVWSENINQILPMIQSLHDNNIKLNIYGWLQFNELKNVPNIEHMVGCGTTEEDARSLVETSLFYPDIRGEHHINLGYIPCRLFKNISYGCIPFTNSKLAYDFFDQKILYSPDSKDFLNNSKNYLLNRNLENDKKLMQLVKENHTYLNRVNDILDFIKIIYK
jgi:hypothetical protein